MRMVLDRRGVHAGKATGPTHFWRRWAYVAITAALAIMPLPHRASAQTVSYDWLQFGGDVRHSGSNMLEATLSPGNVRRLTLLFQDNLPRTIDGAVVELAGVRTPSGVKDVLFATTKAGHLLALDARTGATLWVRQSPARGCRFVAWNTACFTNSSPAIDPNRRFVFSYGLDGYVHKYRVGDGHELTGHGWPELVSARPTMEKVSSALSIARTKDGTAFLYLTTSGPGADVGIFQGHLTTINLATGTQHVFNSVCSNHVDMHYAGALNAGNCPERFGGIWSRSGVNYDPDTGRIYMAIGNGPFDPARRMWGDSVLALNPDGTGRRGGIPLDSYTPTNYRELQAADLDIGSSSPAILPTPHGSAIKHLALQGSKDGLIRLINLDNMSGRRGPGHTGGEVGAVIPVPQGGPVLSVPAVWHNPADGGTWIYIANMNGIVALRLTLNSDRLPRLQTAWQGPSGGTSPLIANGVLFIAGTHSLQALNPLTGARLWQDTSIHNIHWESPVVANGILYITDWADKAFSHLRAYTLPKTS